MVIDIASSFTGGIDILSVLVYLNYPKISFKITAKRIPDFCS